jgi:hypothetical protein
VLTRFSQIISSFLLLIFCAILFNYLFFIEYVNFKKSDFRKELLKSNPCLFEKIEISKDDLFKNKNRIAWHNHNKEITIDGVFYEVAKIVDSKNNKKIVFIIRDNIENGILTTYHSNQNKKKEPLFYFVKLLLNMQHEKNINLNFKFNYLSNASHNKYILCYQDSNYKDKIIKPPCF